MGVGFGGAVKLTGESEYRKALRNITQSLREVDSELKVVTSQYDKTDKSQEALSAQADALAKKYELQAKKVETLEQNYKSMSEKADENRSRHEALRSELEGAVEELQKIEKESGKTSTEYQTQARYVSALTEDYNRSQTAIDGQDVALSKLKTELNNATASMNSTKNELDGLNSEMQEGSSDADSLGNEIKKAGDNANEASEGGFTVLKGVLANLATDAVHAVVNGLQQIGSAVIDVGQQALEAYANYEQLTGGVETLFGAQGQSIEEYAESVGASVDDVRGEYNQLIQAQATVATNAEQAYRTVGMSANEYMETVTGFSSALVSSLGGDTVQAAISADQALQDIADNANKFGSDIDSITAAYSGFARGQYTLLDNLKLGYGGTQSEMERLLADAQAISGVEYDISNLSDVYEAIHVVQTEMGVTGTTAREAASTISGATSMMSASWQNLLSAMAGGGNMDHAIRDFMSSVMAVADNIIPRIQEIIEGFGEVASGLIETLVPQLIELIPPLIENSLPILINTAESVINSILAVLPRIVSSISALIPQVVSTLLGMAPQLLRVGVQVILELVRGISSALPSLLRQLPTIISETVQTLISLLPEIIETGFLLLTSLIQGLTEAMPELVAMLPTVIETLVDTLLDPAMLNMIINSGIELVTALIEGIVESLPLLIEMTPRVTMTFINAIIESLPGVLQVGKDLLNKFIEGAQLVFGTLRAKCSEIYNIVHDKLAELPTALITIGKNLVEGLWNGISSMTDWVISKIQGFSDSVLQGIRDFFGIASPSKVFAELGGYMAQGLGVGFADEMESVTDQMRNSVPTSFDINGDSSTGGSVGGGLDYYTLVNALREALTGVTVEMDDVTMGRFVRQTVTNAIYT